MYIALAGGVGGAKLAHGLSLVLHPEDLTIVVNTGDDFDHLGMRICPDLDTVMYTLAGIANPETGWGVRDETWNFMAALERQNGETWFRLGDRDLQTHVSRSCGLSDGQSLSEVTAALAAGHGIRHPILPASDDEIMTMVRTPEGKLPFQDYFVRLQCAPRVRSFDFVGAAHAVPAPGVAEAFAAAAHRGTVFCPSNPYVSMGPILAVPAIRQAIETRTRPCVAVSPIVGGVALKGPAAKMMEELGHAPSPVAIAEQYRGLIDGIVIDTADATCADAIEKTGIRVLATDAIMRSDADRERLAGETLSFLTELA